MAFQDKQYVQRFIQTCATLNAVAKQKSTRPGAGSDARPAQAWAWMCMNPPTEKKVAQNIQHRCLDHPTLSQTPSPPPGAAFVPCIPEAVVEPANRHERIGLGSGKFRHDNNGVNLPKNSSLGSLPLQIAIMESSLARRNNLNAEIKWVHHTGRPGAAQESK